MTIIDHTPDLGNDHRRPDTQSLLVVADPSPLADQPCADTQRSLVGEGPLLGNDQLRCDTHATSVVADPSPLADQGAHDAQRQDVGEGYDRDDWLELRVWAEMLHDHMTHRIASSNRAERAAVDPETYRGHLDALLFTENELAKAMRKCYKRIAPPEIRAWQVETLGMGDHLVARLLGHMGHPVIAHPHHWEGTGAKRVLVADEPYRRTLGQLLQYAGHGAPGRAKKGASAEDLFALGNPKLKMLVHLLAEAAVKAQVRKFPDAGDDFDPSSRYALGRLGDVYLTARKDSAEKVHATDCVRCGPSGRPALVGSPWSKGHQQAHALRIVGKDILRQLWIVGGGHTSTVTHRVHAALDDPDSASGGQIDVDTYRRSATGGTP